MSKVKTSGIGVFHCLKLSNVRVILSSMFSLHMLLKTTLIQIRSLLLLRTKLAQKSVSLIVNLMRQLMLLQIGATGKTLVALGALIWFFSRVDSLVSDQVGDLGEGL